MSINSNTNPQQFLMHSQIIAREFGERVDTTSDAFQLFPALLTEYQSVLNDDFEVRLAAARDSAISSARASFESQLSEVALESDDRVSTLVTRVEHLTAVNKQSLGQLKLLETQVCDLNAELAEAKASHEQAIAKSTKVSASNQEGLTRELQGLRANLSELTEENDGLKSANKDLQSQVSSLRSEANASSSKAQAQIQELTADLNHAQTQIGSLQSKHEAGVRDLEDENHQLKATNTSLEAKVKALEAKIAASQEQLNQAKTLTTADKIKQYTPAILGAGFALAGIAFGIFA